MSMTKMGAGYVRHMDELFERDNDTSYEEFLSEQFFRNRAKGRLPDDTREAGGAHQPATNNKQDDGKART